tara:strand:+ start:2081 stop:2953 length:873 start_codon:yes stop_codon:yes gene_type:complete
MNDLLKEAIADAKAVRETAMANAKAALEEAFTPRLQSMLHAKLAEEMDDEMEMEEDMELDLGDEMEAPIEPEMEEDMEPEMELDMEPEMEEDMEPEMELDMEEDADMDLDLDEILRELEGADEITDEEPVIEADYDEDIDLDEVIASLREEEGDEEELTEVADEEEMEEGKYEKEMEEAYNVIRYLKSQLQEVNLLNAKLLFSNKLFKNHELNESQKMKVIENFDRAHNMREVKLVYSTLAEGFGKTKSKVRIKESYASKPTKSTKPAASVITEGNELATRWKKLAGLSK